MRRRKEEKERKRIRIGTKDEEQPYGQAVRFRRSEFFQKGFSGKG